MIPIGNFFFKYRNYVFIFLYLALFIPSPLIFTQEVFGETFYYWPIIIGLVITISGQAIRGATIGLAYIVRGGKNKQVYADTLVTEGIFNHCRNPLYVGNILMLLGVGILSNSAYYVGILIPVFLFIYQAIVLAEENFLRNKFGEQFNVYCSKVNRWWINLSHIGKTFGSMQFNAKRWILKEYNTQFVWLAGIAAILLINYPHLTENDPHFRNSLLTGAFIFLALGYILVRYLKKSGKMVE
jgi:protein-S-isoprenylcysteine O-methyltransferase Ste14